MDELEARLTILTYELESIQASIRALDTILFQIKGWCVTATLAIAGVTVTSKRPSLLLVAVSAAVGFWLVDAIFKSIQRVFILRNLELEQVICCKSVISALAGDELRGPKIATAFAHTQPSKSHSQEIARKVGPVLREAKAPLTFSLYIFLLACLALEGLLLLT